jgi:hypothetical protein
MRYVIAEHKPSLGFKQQTLSKAFPSQMQTFTSRPNGGCGIALIREQKENMTSDYPFGISKVILNQLQIHKYLDMGRRGC